MTTPTRDDLALYVMGEYDGDPAALEGALAGDSLDAAAARAFLADEARFEGLLREAAAAATFCPACRDLARADRCDACGAALRPGGYAVDKVLVSNAHGRMYVARDADGAQVALKELAFVQTPSLEVVAAFEREARFLRALEHPAIPRFVASFEEGEGVHTRYYLAQELVAGRSLAALLDDHWFSEAEAKDVARQVLKVLVYLQALSPMVIHRDIKPANLLRRADGTVAVVDFGAAHVQGTTAGSTSIGTFGYMPIEQLAGQVDATTDPFALGASLLHLLSRQEPWRIVQSRALVDAINVSAGLRGFLARLVAAEPADRFADAASALAALDALDAGGEVTALATTKRPVKARRNWWRPILYAAATLAMLGIGGGGFAMARHYLHADDRSDGAGAGSSASAGLPVMPAWPMPMLIDGNDEPMMLRGQQEPMPMPGPPPARLPPGASVDLSFKQAPLADVVRLLGAQCKVNVIVPDYIHAAVTVHLERAPCDQALEVLLESRGLWYVYRPEANLVRVAPRHQLDDEQREREERRELAFTDDSLPDGPSIDLDVKDAPLADVLGAFSGAAGINVIVPDEIRTSLTVRGQAMPWAPALQEVLAANGLWYRYRPNGRILRIAPRHQLDDEERATRDRLP